MLWNPDTILWTLATLGFTWHVIHAQRMPTLWAAKLSTKKNRFSIPPWVFWVAWVTVLTCDAIFAVLFFKDNIDFGTYYQLNGWTFFGTFLTMMAWNWVYFNVICIYAVGMLGVMISVGHILLLTFTWLYGGQHWFTLLIIAVPIVWTLPAGIFSLIFAYREAANLSKYKKEISGATRRLEAAFLGESQRSDYGKKGTEEIPLTEMPAPPPPLSGNPESFTGARRQRGTPQFT